MRKAHTTKKVDMDFLLNGHYKLLEVPDVLVERHLLIGAVSRLSRLSGARL